MTEDASPYVGPRPFERKHAELFFGRDREANELLSLIIAHTEVLLYAQSGAGKSSLVNARLIPLLEAEGFDVLPPARVQGIVEGVAAQKIGNIYTFHSLMTWAGLDADPERFARMSLADFFRERKTEVDEEGTPVLRILIFDQFEELFTFYPDRWQERRGFFDQVRQASDAANGSLRTLFVMREDHVAEVEPYASILPEKFRVRFRLSRMLEQNALACVKRPLEKTHRYSFAPGVAEALIDQLLRLEITGPDGKRIQAKEQFVELVQLQVVCQDLWDKLSPDKNEIGMDDLVLADPSKALLQFYERCIRQTAAQTLVPEAKIRVWFERALVTPAATRGTVFRGETETQGLPNAAVDILENLHLIRAEIRGGGRWYELTHDRFIESVQIARRQWREANAATEAARRRLEDSAQQWELDGRSRARLLNEGRLFEAKQLLRLPDVERLGISDAARSLVDMSQLAIDDDKRRKEDELKAAQTLAIEQRRRAQILAVVLSIAIVFGIFAFCAQQYALAAQQRALEAQKRAEEAQKHAEESRLRTSVRQLAGQAYRRRDDKLDLALLLALEARTTAEKLQGTELDKRMTLTDATSSVLFTLLGPPGLQRLMHGHLQPVQSIALTADSKLLASGDMDGIVRLWQANGLAPSRNLKSKFKVIYSLAFSSAGKILAGCGNLGGGAENNGIMVWNIATGSPLGEALPTKGRQVAFSPDGTYLASPSGDKIVLWKMPDLAQSQKIELQTNDKPPAPVNRLAFSPNVNPLTLAAAGDDQVVRIWNIAAGSVQTQLLPPAKESYNQVYSLSFSPDGTRIASGWLDRKILIWDVDHPDSPETLAGHSSPVFALAFSADGKTLISGGTDRTVQKWDLSATLRKPEPLSGYAEEIYSLAIDNQNQVFAGTGKGTIAVWNLAAHQPRLADQINLPLDPNDYVRCVSLLGDHGQSIAFGTSAGTIFIWNLAKSELATSLQAHKSPVLCIASSPDGKTWASASDEGIMFWNADGKPLGGMHGEKGAVSALAFSPDGQLLASNTSGMEIVLWDGKSQKLLDTPFIGHAGRVNSLAFSPDGKKLAAGDADEKVILWDVDTRTRIGSKPLCEFDDPTYSPVFSVAFSSKGLVAAAGRDPNIIIRNTEFPSTNSATQRLEKHRSEVKTLAFSPNGQMLASASQDGTLILWDVPTGQFVYSLLVGKASAEKQRPIFGLAFTGDGSRLVSAGSEVLVWDLSLDGWLQRASVIAERNFAPSEWTEFLPDEKYHPTFVLGLLMEAHEDALKNDTKAAEAAYRTLTEWVSKGKNADLNYEVGRWGILDGFASAVAAACKNAVTMAPAETAWMHFDLRAVELALAGQRADAIHDLENYVQRADGEKMRTRKVLLDKLKSGSNLSTADVSETLGSE